MGSQPLAVSFAEGRVSGRVLLSSSTDRDGQEVKGSIDLRGNEGLIVRVESALDYNGNKKRANVMACRKRSARARLFIGPD